MLKDDLYSLLIRYLSDALSKEQVAQLAEFLSLMSKWNKTYNLTAITEPKEMVIRHILDSLSLSPYLNGDRIIDVGTGGGLPGIPLAVYHPQKQFVLLDSNTKKTRFLLQAVMALGLKNVEVVNSRVEAYKPEVCFDTVITRAFSSIHDMLLKTHHLCCKSGVFLAMKGQYPHDELAEVLDGYVVRGVEPLTIQDLGAERHLVIISAN